MIIDEVIIGLLTDDDVKVLKHLQSIDNLFKKGNLNICEIFCNNGHIEPTIEIDGEEYEIASFNNIKCDGGDPDNYGRFGLHTYYDLVEKLEKGGEE